MKTLTVEEASQGLSDWLRRAASGEQIAYPRGRLHRAVAAAPGVVSV